MLLQRLVMDAKIGFNYDYMGAAEYEYGATRVGRIALAQAFLDGTVAATTTQFVERHGRSSFPAIEVVVLGLRDRIATIGPELVISTSKESFRTRTAKIVGWMHVGHTDVEPMLILRTDCLDANARVDLFMRPFIEGLQEERAESSESV